MHTWRPPYDLLILPVALLLLAWIGMRSLEAASPVTYSDESAHIVRVLDLENAMHRAPTTWARTATWLFSGDAYPNGLNCAALPFVRHEHTITGARKALLAFGLAHVVCAVLLGRRLWGAPGAWAYAAMVFLSPFALAFLRLYYLDVGLVAAVGVGILAVEASEGFKRTGPTLVFVCAAVVGMYTKWMWALFCGVPVLIAAFQAIADAPGWRRRLAWSAALLGLVAGLLKAVVWGGTAWTHHGVPDALAAFPYVVSAAGIAVLWALVALILAWRGRAISARINLALSTLVIGGVAGPWYALVYHQLWGRLDHEKMVYADRNLGAQAQAASLEVVRALIPAGEILLVLGLIIALFTRRGRASLVGRIVGGAAAGMIVAELLPFDPRYLLPLLPILAGAIVSGWATLRPRIAIPALCLVVVPLLLTGVGPLFNWSPLAASMDRGSRTLPVPVLIRRTHGLPVPFLTSSPAPATPEQIDSVVAALRELCGVRTCRVSWAMTGGPGSTIAARDVQAMGRWGGVEIEVSEGTQPGSHPLGSGATRCGLFSSDAGPAGWTGSTWHSDLLPGGCRIELTGL